MPIDESYPCPKCGATGLIYEGMLVWRSGPRPPRELARKNVAISPRADVEREQCYRCNNCGAQYYADWDQRRPHLYNEGAPGKYLFSATEGTWLQRAYHPEERTWRMEPVVPQPPGTAQDSEEPDLP